MMTVATVPPTPPTSNATTLLPSLHPVGTKIAAGNSTISFQLQDRPTIGIVVLYLTMIDFAEIDSMYQSVETLNRRGVTHIVIDVVGGDGGCGPLDKALQMNFRVIPTVQHLSTKIFNSTDGGWKDTLENMLSIRGGAYYDSSRFFDFDNNRTYTDSSMHHGAPLSKYQYAAGGATHLNFFNGIFSFANLRNSIKGIPYQSVIAIAVGEIVAPGSNGLPLDFDAAKYPTDFRMDYDHVVARSKEALWTRVAGDAWK
ncbi:hypothetical protein BGZ95_010887 [Linnemannia exigua]|uniref:Uncharacterized protein n=1 Tax=Linnemannia exigua TaxID=604196 RepID=A0AAD4DAW1_9FUNG|nr:hypothetical protein BGZ95_010887 [Linnemannia exigua]